MNNDEIMAEIKVLLDDISYKSEQKKELELKAIALDIEIGTLKNKVITHSLELTKQI